MVHLFSWLNLTRICNQLAMILLLMNSLFKQKKKLTLKLLLNFDLHFKDEIFKHDSNLDWLSSKTLQIEVECSFGKPSCCNSDDKVSPLQLCLVEHLRINSIKATQDLISFISSLVSFANFSSFSFCNSSFETIEFDTKAASCFALIELFKNYYKLFKSIFIMWIYYFWNSGYFS